jgi:hypothetical protein
VLMRGLSGKRKSFACLDSFFGKSDSEPEKYFFS